jgi:hypothetical protein
MVATADNCEFLLLAAESLRGWHPMAAHKVDKLGAPQR